MATASKKEEKKVSIEAFFKEKKKIEEKEKTKDVNEAPMADFFKALKKPVKSEAISMQDLFPTKAIENAESEIEPNVILESIKDTIKKEYQIIAEKQSEIIEEIKRITSGKPSDDIVSFFKLFKFDVKSMSGFLIMDQLDRISEDIESEDFKKNIKLVAKSDDEKLKNNLKKFKTLISSQFIAKLKEIKELSATDEGTVLIVLTKLSSVISSVKYYIPKVETDSNLES